MRRSPVLLSVLLCAAAVAAPAGAAPSQESLFMDDDQLLHSSDNHADRTLQELKDLGVDRLRLSLIWRNVAPDRQALTRPGSLTDPTDPRQYPAVEFDNLDHVLRVARRLGLDVLLNVRGGAPEWALGRYKNKPYGRDAYKPSPAQFAQFVQMVGRRYDGTYRDENQGGNPLPRVTAWSIWNEPNWGGLLQPQWQREKRTRQWRPFAPRHYRALYRAATDGLRRSGHGDDTILIGETAPLGSPKPGLQSHLRPARFLRELFCLDAGLRPMRPRVARRAGCDYGRRGPLPATGYAHHPYPVMAPPAQPTPDKEKIALADSARLKAILDAAAAAGRIPQGLPLWYTEFGYQTAPPDPFRGIALDTHARWLVEAERMTYEDPRVAAHAQFLLRDDDPQREYAPTHKNYWGTYQSGLQFADGTPKPAYAAYRFPLMAPARVAPGQPLELWGLLRPGANGTQQRIRIQWRARAEDQWSTLSDRAVSDFRGYFTEVLPAPQTGFYRFEWVQPPPTPRPGLLPGSAEEPPPPPPYPASEPLFVTVG